MIFAMTAPAALARSSLSGWFEVLRPRQWVKNLFVLPAPLFGLAHASASAGSALRVFGAFAAFCALSSSIYVVNDVIDADADRLHPVKRGRPIASGRVTSGAALLLSLCLFLSGAAAALLLGREFAVIGLVYVANSIAYLSFFKRRVIADVLSIAVGFMVRILGGAVVVDVEPSSWLLICGFSLALFLGFCKRRSEIEIYQDEDAAAGVRAVFSSYSREKLNLLSGATAAIAIVTYMLFTASPETIARHGTTALIYTSPFVVYCVFRFLMKTLELRGEDAAETVFTDLGFISAGLGWVATVAWILYRTKSSP
jgi:4-hydroxybenzoate polyprenyltransferase